MVKLQTIRDARGNITVIERLPFPIRRVYYLHGIEPGASRGGHSHRALRRLFVAVAGAFTIEVDGLPIRMDDPAQGLYIDPLQWIDLYDFTPGAVCLVLASEEYKEADYIRGRNDWARLRKAAA